MDARNDADLQTDARLAQRIREGDADAFTKLMERYHPELHSYLAYAVGSEDIADDLLQDLFLRLWHARASLVLDSSWRTYLYRAARNHVLDYTRGASRARAAMTRYAADTDARTGSDSTDDPEQAELWQAVSAAIQELPPRAREVWTLHRDQGLTYDEVAAVLGISRNSVKSHMARAMAGLRQAIGPFLVVLALVRV